MMRTIYMITLGLAFILSAAAFGHDYVPGEAQSHPVLLKGGTLYTVTGGIMPNTDLLFDNGRITAIGQDITVPDGTETIDVSGKLVYPGLIAPYTSIGLVEIGEVRATDDRREVGPINPNVKAHLAYNPDSEIIPSVRSNGITTALIVPSGRLLTGTSSLLNLDGWTWEDAAAKLDVGIHLKWPNVKIQTGWWEERSAEEQKKDMEENRRLVYQAFDDARVYYRAKLADPTIKEDIRWEALIPVFEKKMPVFIEADDYRQIEQAVHFAKDYDIRMVLVGGRDSWMRPELLTEKDIPVIVSWVQALPSRQDESYDLVYSLPAKLAEAKVKFCIAKGGGTGVRNLPFQAGQAIAYGLSPENALRSVTLTPAEVFGISNDLGSLEVGKKATIIVSEGDLFDIATHKIVHEFIEGRPVDLNNKHKELWEKYKQKHVDR